MTKIHATAIVDPKARLGAGVEIGPYTIVGPDVTIGDGTRVGSHGLIEGHTEIGARCEIFSHVVLGTPPQVRQRPKRSFLKIGDDNLIREFVTANPGMKEDSVTRIGSRNFIMIGVHFAHDCQVGNDLTIANGVGLAGHVSIDDHATIGGLAGVHQHVRIGKYAMVGAVSKVTSDVPPFVTCDGHPAAYHGINAVGLKRAGFSSQDRLAIRQSLKILLASGKNLTGAIDEVRRKYASHAHVATILDFLSDSKRGVIRNVSAPADDVE